MYCIWEWGRRDIIYVVYLYIMLLYYIIYVIFFFNIDSEITIPIINTNENVLILIKNEGEVVICVMSF